MILFLVMLTNLWAEDLKSFELVIKDHVFQPTTLEVPANVKFELIVKNQDKAFEEFESKKLVVEKFVGPGKMLKLKLGPLSPGEYDFFGDFHPKTARGILVVK